MSVPKCYLAHNRKKPLMPSTFDNQPPLYGEHLSINEYNAACNTIGPTYVFASLTGDNVAKMRRVIGDVFAKSGTAWRLTQNHVHQQLESLVTTRHLHQTHTYLYILFFIRSCLTPSPSDSLVILWRSTNVFWILI